MNLIDLGPFRRLIDFRVNTAGIVPSVGKGRHDHTDHNRNSQIFHNSNNSHQQNNEGINQRHFAQNGQAIPSEGADDNHKHYAHKRGQWDQFNHARSDQNKQQQEQGGSNTRDTGPATRFDVDHGLTNHRAAAHTTEKAGNGVGHTLGNTLLACTATLVGDLTHKVQGQQAFDQTNGSQNDGIGQNDLKGFPI